MLLLGLAIEHWDKILMGVTSIITGASLITAGTKTPKQGTKLHKIYGIVEKIALVVGKAKDKDY